MQACFSSVRDWLCNRNRVQRRRGRAGEKVGFSWGVGGLMIQLLPGDHRAGLRLTGGGGGGAELREAAVTRLQAGHRTPEGRNKRSRENMSEHELHTYATPEHPPSASD